MRPSFALSPGPGQESVWDYPRPPRSEPFMRRVRVIHGESTLADSARAIRVLETSHPPAYYIPAEDVSVSLLREATHRTFCEYKGWASYWDVVVGSNVVRDAAWSYPKSANGYESLTGRFAFYPSKVDQCLVDDEVVIAQDGDFYGGWITADIVGPFKGGGGTRG